MEVAGTWPDLEIEARHGFEIVVEDVGPRLDDDFQRAVLLEEIRCQHLDGGQGRCGADGADGAGKMRGTAIVEVVAVNRGDDRMR